ncbi:MAG: HDOD domain-containing protein [Desulfobacteraceae bacterium]|jgi:putative nucleotidyltransferase with HDIG domain
MSYLPIDTLKNGQILDEDVHDVNGRLLLSRGQPIESKHIRIFKIWGVAQVRVANGEVPPQVDRGKKDSEKMACVEASTRQLFKKTNLNHPLMETVFQSMVDYRYEHDLLSVVGKYQGTSESLQVDLRVSDIQRKIRRGGIKLPEVPTIVAKLNELMDDPHASSHDVAQIVGSSPSLSAILFRIVNSAAFGLPTKVDSIVRAVSLLGTRQISSLAIGISVMQAFGKIPGHLIDMADFIIHSLACATIARIIAALANMKNTEQVFIGGLLHDIGKLILFKYFPDEIKSLLWIQENENLGRSLYEIEKKSIGTTHARIARILLEKWNFHDDLKDNVVYHHAPSRARVPAEASIIQIADIIAHGTGFGSSAERIIPGFDEKAWDHVDLSPNTIKSAVRQATHQLQTVKSAIF